MRYVICHYHIYKNSGTSFDRLLTDNFGEKHICFDGPFPFFSIDQDQLKRIIDRQVDKVAFSSHQTVLPVPVSLDYVVLPVIFIRHPLLRIQSIYNFKRKDFDGTITSKNAQKYQFDEWLQKCFIDNQEITHVSNAQTRIVGATYKQLPLMKHEKNKVIYDINQAIRNINNVELLARTEFYSNDVSRFPTILKKYDIDFQLTNLEPQNVTNNHHGKNVEERLEMLEKLIDKNTYNLLIDANQQDLKLYDFVSDKIYFDKA